QQKPALHMADAVADMLTDRQTPSSAFLSALDLRITQRAEQVAVLRLAQRLLNAACRRFFDRFELILFQQWPLIAVLAAFPRRAAYHHVLRRRWRDPGARHAHDFTALAFDASRGNTFR